MNMYGSRIDVSKLNIGDRITFLGQDHVKQHGIVRNVSAKSVLVRIPEGEFVYVPAWLIQSVESASSESTI